MKLTGYVRLVPDDTVTVHQRTDGGIQLEINITLSDTDIANWEHTQFLKEVLIENKVREIMLQFVETGWMESKLRSID